MCSNNSEIKPNIIFLTIDAFQARRFFGNNRTAKTPNIDRLLEKATYFTQAFCSADGTILSLNSMFNSLFPFATGVRQKKIYLENTNLFQHLKNFAYNIYGIIPKATNLSPLHNFFKNKDVTFDALSPTAYVTSSLGERIIDMVKKHRMEMPWFYYVHIFDLHPPFNVHKNFQNEKFGDGEYDKLVSSVDSWLGDLINEIDFENTVFIVTADHGLIVPFDNRGLTDFEPKFKQIVHAGRKIVPPPLQPVGVNFLNNLRGKIRDKKVKNANKGLTPFQIRSRLPFFTLSLFDEVLHIPLLFVGKNIKHELISNQVSGVDIFPTIANLIDSPIKEKIHGKNLIPFSQESRDESAIYLHTIPYEKTSPDDKVGIRTQNYKYFRNSRDSLIDVNLYDLKNDPEENQNIAENHPDIVTKMEILLKNLLVQHEKNSSTEIDDEELAKIHDELKNFGYI